VKALSALASDKTKDNPKARKDLALVDQLWSYPFSLKPKRKKQLMKWLKNLKFPDGYDACYRRSMNLKMGKFSELNCHDYHIIMERLPVMLCGFVKMMCGKR
jgi:hypothetical protein